MVVAVFPLVKIGLLLLKQLSKPVANIIKNEAKKHPVIRKHVIVPLGKVYNWTENKAAMSLKGHQVEKVTEEEAVELGANAVGEIILFGLLCLILLAEMNRQGDKKAVIEKTKAEEIGNLKDAVLELNSDIMNMKVQLEIIRKRLENQPDLFELEEERHVQVNDYDFWDVLTSKHTKKRKKTDTSSPSI